MDIQLYNSLTRKIEKFAPINANEVRMYSCGPTVYNYAHIGNMRAFLFADFLQRTLRTVGGFEVRWVMNITNIDDKTIRDSSPESTAWRDEMGKRTTDPIENLLMLTRFYEKSFIDDISSLGIDPKHFFSVPKATEYIKEMQDLIRSIVESGVGYVSEGSVYFNVAEWRKRDTYGKLFKIDFENFRAGTRVDTDQYEREQASDFALWKARKPGEPYWEFEIGGEKCDGRPGWHIECSAMEKVLLGLPFDIHTGGIDLKFPHHEDEIAQSKAGYGIEPTAFWCHNEFLEVEGQKMSKSLGNFFTVRDLVAKGISTVDLRFAMLSAHYRSVYNYTGAGLSAAQKARKRIQDFIYDLIGMPQTEGNSELTDSLREKVFSELANDLHTPKALAHIFSFINSTNPSELSGEDRNALLGLFRQLNEIFAAWEFAPRVEEAVTYPTEVIELANERVAAKAAKDWAKCDELRARITEMGFNIKDKKDGYELEPIK